MFCDDISALVVHIGHLKSYVGFVGDEMPSYQTDSFFHHDINDATSFLLTDEFSPNMDLANGIITPLLSNKKINNVEHYSHFISRLSAKINIDLSEVGVFLTTHLHEHAPQERISLMANFFEKRDCPALFFCAKNLTCMFANGRHTGIVVDSGAYSTEVTSVYQGHLLKKCNLTSFQKC